MSLKRLSAIAIALILFGGLLAACGSSSSSSSSEASTSSSTEGGESSGGSSSAAVQEAEEEITEIESRPTSIGLEEPLKKAPPTGKTVDFLACGNPICQKLGDSFKEAADALGWKVNIVNLGLTPESILAGWNKAKEDHPDAIQTTGGYPREIFQEVLEEIVAEGTIVTTQGDSLPAGNGIAASIDGPERYENNGKRIAQILMKESGGTANVLITNIPEVTSTTLQDERAAEFLEENCPECTVASVDISGASKNPAADIAAQVQKRPDVEYLVVPFSDYAEGVPAALASVQRSDVKIVSQALDNTPAEYMKRGENVVSVYGYPGVEIAWRVADALARLFNGESAKTDEALTYPEWVLTAENLPTNVKEVGYFPFVEEYKSQYLKLWGLE